jgi:hypothetical protein
MFPTRLEIRASGSFRQEKKGLIALGEYFQVHDYYLDCYGDPEHIGKIGTDIQAHKGDWLSTMALIFTPQAQQGTGTRKAQSLLSGLLTGSAGGLGPA